MVTQSTGLRRPKLPPEIADRLPPGQFLAQRWPVLHYGEVPSFDPETWDFRVTGHVERKLLFSWQIFLELPRIVVNSDMHCVTRWSKLDHVWEGVSSRHLIELAGVKPEARHVLFHSEGGYTANVPLDVFSEDDVLLALKHDGEDLTPEHGFPLRMIVPSRYAWKSAKWLRMIEFLNEDQLGFWEKYGYNNNADFLKEERFAE
jgi:DMSO/TMAO reductase YedYZ molybdopterin-dependent catalytic subunit